MAAGVLATSPRRVSISPLIVRNEKAESCKATNGRLTRRLGFTLHDIEQKQEHGIRKKQNLPGTRPVTHGCSQNSRKMRKGQKTGGKGGS